MLVGGVNGSKDRVGWLSWRAERRGQTGAQSEPLEGGGLN